MSRRYSSFQRSALVALLVLVPLLTAGRIRDAFAGPRDTEATAENGAMDVLYSRTFRVAQGQTLDVDLGKGDVVVQTTAGNEASVVVEGYGANARAEFDRLRFTAEARNSRLTVRTNPERQWGPSRSNARLRVVLRIPSRFNVNVATGSGDVSVGRLTGTLDLQTGSGDVTADAVRNGQTQIQTGSGDVRLGNIDGALDLETGSGDIEIERQNGRATVDTGSGDVQITLWRVSDLNVDTGSGDVRIDLPRRSNANVDLTGSRIEIASALRFDGRQARRTAVGRLGSGGSRLTVDTGSGDIELAAR